MRCMISIKLPSPLSSGSQDTWGSRSLNRSAGINDKEGKTMTFVIGLVVGAALLGLVLWLKHKGIAVRWYEWLLAALGFVILVWTIHDFFGSMAEYNEAAARIFLWMLGTPTAILIGLAVFLPWWRHFRKGKLVASASSNQPAVPHTQA